MDFAPDIYGRRAMSSKSPDQLPYIAPGVRGLIVSHESWSYIPLIYAINPGQGDVARFLDRLDPTRNWKVPTVIDAKLLGMLERRGFKWSLELAPDGEVITVHYRLGQAGAPRSKMPERR